MIERGGEEAWDSRTELLLGQAEAESLRAASVLVMGLGGVGADPTLSEVKDALKQLQVEISA